MTPRQKNHLTLSVRVIQGLFILAWLVLMGRLFQLQILDYDRYAPISQQNIVRQEIIPPSRGLIYDRNGAILVENEPIYSISITPANMDTTRIPLLASLLQLEEDELRERIRQAQSYSWHRSSRLVTEVSFDIFSDIQENSWQLPGIHHQIESKRRYPLPLRASHTLGYLREASREEYLADDEIRLGDQVGKSGLEMTYEEHLRGDAGIGYTQVNAMGQALGPYPDHELTVPPVKGSDLISTLDAELQALAERLMVNKKGSLVALDPQTGEILAMVSSPQYDLSRLAGQMDLSYWQSLNENLDNPLYNRAISSLQPPGSTFKPIMGLIGLHFGLVTPETEIYNPGAYYRGRAYGDLADPGYYDLELALTRSSNTYFFWMMDRIASRGWLNEWSRLAKDFGLGIQNGIDLPFETTGIIPDSTYMNRTFGERQWGVGDLMSLGVGQGMVSVSPLQMAVATSAIANGGFRVQPHLVRAIRRPDGQLQYTRPDRHQIEWIEPNHLQTVQTGMRRVVTEGSGRYYVDIPDLPAAGKTGTAQNPQGENHGWFITYAPYDDPQIAIAVLIENAGFGSQTASPIAAVLIEQYLTGEVTRQRVLDLALSVKSEGLYIPMSDSIPAPLVTEPQDSTPQPVPPVNDDPSSLPSNPSNRLLP
ncbi:MAG: penicillin-binding protein 2 [Bacteroidota bacterium]